MKKRMLILLLISLVFIVLLFIYIGNSSKITEEDLIGGTWEATAGYKDGKPSGDPYCLDFLIEGLKFKRDGVVYGKRFDDEFDYELEEGEEGTEIMFTRKNRYHIYYIDKINNDEIGLVGALESMNNHSCYFKRNK